MPAVHTPAQAAFIQKLLKERTGYSVGFATRVTAGIATGDISKAKASEIIDWMLKLPKVGAPLPKAGESAPAAVEITEGFWITDAAEHDIDVVKVQRAVHGSGKLYAKRLHVHVVGMNADGTSKVKGSWEYVPGLFNSMREGSGNPRPMTVDEAKKYGKLYGVCSRCGATLTREDSIERMMGSTCYGHMMSKGHAL